MEKLYKYKAIIEYDGTKYHGFQIQNDYITVSKVIEEAIRNFSRETVSFNIPKTFSDTGKEPGYSSSASRLTQAQEPSTQIDELLEGRELDTSCNINRLTKTKKIDYAGRTDSGVHARGQVISFELSRSYPSYKILEGLNFFLRGRHIVITKISKVKNDFHARFSAKEREYQYLILNRRSPSVLLDKRCWHVKYKLNMSNIRTASKYLIGEHDFTSFRNTECQAKSPIKTINKIIISKKNDLITITISAPSFLHNQIRIIVGTLIDIGGGKLSAEDVPRILSAKNRIQAGQTAPAYGL